MTNYDKDFQEIAALCAIIQEESEAIKILHAKPLRMGLNWAEQPKTKGAESEI